MVDVGITATERYDMSNTEPQEKIIKIKDCNECPYLKSDRYSYCSKRYKNCPEAYRNGGHAEYTSEIPWLYKNCPLEDTDKPPIIKISTSYTCESECGMRMSVQAGSCTRSVCEHKKPVPGSCPHCAFLDTLGDPQSNREYWLITEIFVHLHKGKDYCDWKKSETQEKKDEDF